MLVPSFKQSMFYDPDFGLLLGGGNSNDPCSPQDLMWTWICLGFLLGVIVLCVLIVIVSCLTHKTQAERADAIMKNIQTKNKTETHKDTMG